MTLIKYISFITFLSFFFQSFISCKGIDKLPKSEVVSEKKAISNSTSQDSITMIATKLYDAGLLKKAFQGRGYRKAWATPVTILKVRLDTLYGGLTPIEKGGGRQTQSLELSDTKGNSYTLRSINKDPSSLVPDFAHKFGIAGIVTDGISAQHPYGALIVPPMADALGLWHTAPRIVYLEPQMALDSFNHEFKDRMYLLEYETNGIGKWTNLNNIVAVTDTEGMQELEQENENFTVDTSNLIRARLFDLLIGDWDRHAKNWGWIITETDGKMLATVMACDRDNVFYGIGGVIPSIINRPFIQPLLRPFKKRIDYMPGMIKPFDAHFLYGVPEELFLQEAAYLQENLTDEVIDNAIKNWPVELQELDGERIAKKIKARREKLKKYAHKFHEILVKRGPLDAPLKGSTKLWGEIHGEDKPSFRQY